jgi:large subunit ribosomal protein L9
MEIIILESLNKLGKAGDVVNVKDGFARNFLIPQKKAIVANKKNKSDLEKKMSEITKLKLKKLKMLKVKSKVKQSK